MNLEREAVAASRVAFPPAAVGSRTIERVPYAMGYQAGARRPITDQEVDAAARAINPEAWRVFDQDGAEERELIVHRSRVQARAALEAARAAR